MRNISFKLASASIDWLTCTIGEPHHPADWMKRQAAIHQVATTHHQGIEPKPWAWYGYYGYSLPGLKHGTRRDGSIVVASGPEANAIAWLLPVDSMRCSRIDLALTFWLDKDMPHLAKKYALEAHQSRAQAKSGANRRITLYDGFGAGDSLYIGSRSSDQMGRFYDKARESGQSEYKNAWRAEVEFKDERATKVWRSLARLSERERSITTTVANWWRDRGVHLPGPLPAGVQADSRLPTATRDDERQIAWLRDQVQPTVKRLVARVGTSAILEALGLSE